jgi:hypothetical protein
LNLKKDDNGLYRYKYNVLQYSTKDVERQLYRDPSLRRYENISTPNLKGSFSNCRQEHELPPPLQIKIGANNREKERQKGSILQYRDYC